MGKVMSIKTEMRMVDMKTEKELLTMEELVLSMAQTMYIMKDGEVLMTMRRKMFSFEGKLFVYEGKAEFDWMNNTTAKKLFTIRGFGIKNIFGATYEDMATGQTCAVTKETVLALTDTYSLVVQPGYDASLFMAMQLCCDKMKEKSAAGGA